MPEHYYRAVSEHTDRMVAELDAERAARLCEIRQRDTPADEFWMRVLAVQSIGLVLVGVALLIAGKATDWGHGMLLVGGFGCLMAWCDKADWLPGSTPQR